MSTPRKSGPRNSLGRPWVQGEAWSCSRCGKSGPDRDDFPQPLCLPREGAHPSLAYHDDLSFEPEAHNALVLSKRALRTPVDFGGST